MGNHLSDNANFGGKQASKNTDMPAAFTANGNDLTIVDASLAKSMRVAEAMLSSEARARVEKEAAVPYNAIKAAGHEPMTTVAQKGDTYWSIAETLLASRGHVHAGNKEIQSTVNDMAAINDKPGDKVNHVTAGEIVRLPLQ